MTQSKTEKFIKQVIFKFLNPKDCKVFIFGSRATDKAKKFSDFDVGVKGKKPLSFKTLALIKDALEESDLPFTVDVIDFSTASKKFQENALKQTKKL